MFVLCVLLCVLSVLCVVGKDKRTDQNNKKKKIRVQKRYTGRTK